MKPYPHYPDRESIDLDGVWDFAWLDDGRIETLDPGRIAFDETMAVPGAFDLSPGHLGARGIGAYRTSVRLATSRGERLRLTFRGMGLRGKVWWDGVPVGEYDLPYSPCTFDIGCDAAATHELVVALDNRFDAERMPLFQPQYDFYAYGGIWRSVEVARLPLRRIERVQVRTSDLADGAVQLRALTGGVADGPARLTVAFDDGVAHEHRVAFAGGEATIELRVPDFRIWSPESPALHTVTVSLDGDRVTERFGIRTIGTRGRELLLNGEPVRLAGVNRHEAHPQAGPVQSDALLVEDLHRIRALGATFVRCVHYPQDQRFLDLCDQAGLVVWEESLAWGLGPDACSDPLVMDMMLRQTRSMVRTSVNHPSVIFWAFLNECASHTERSRPLYRALFDAVRSEDASRLVTYACDKNSGERIEDLFLEYADVATINTYPGWIGDVSWHAPSVSRIAPHLARKVEQYDAHPSLRDKPLLVTEIGACALYGAHSVTREQWTEEYQAEYVAEACRAVLGEPRFCGITLWQFADSRSYGPWGQVRTKPLGINHAGLLDGSRRPKLAFESARAAFAAARATSPPHDARPRTRAARADRRPTTR